MKKLLLLLVLLLTWGGVSLHAETWKKVTSTDDITLDGTYIVVYETGKVAMGYTLSSSHLGYVAITVANDIITTTETDKVAYITLEGSSVSACALKISDNSGTSYGYYTVSGKGKLSLSSTLSSATSASLRVGDKTTTSIVFDNKSYPNLAYNTGSKFFGSYASNTASSTPAVQLYKKEATEPEPYTFPYDKQTFNMDVNTEKTLAIADAHPTIKYTWTAANEANNENFEVTEENNVITLTALAADTYTVTASWDADGTWAAGSATFTVNVNRLKYAPTFDAVINTVKGENVTLKIGESHPNFTYSFGTEGIVTIKDNVLTAVAQGSTTVTAKWGDDEWEEGEATFTVNVNDKRVFNPGFADIELNVKDIHDWAWDENNCPEITYAFTEEGIVAFAGSVMSAEKAGKTTVTASWGDDNWAEGNATFTVTVSQKTYSPELPESLELTVGQNGEFKLEADAPTITFTSSNDEGLLVDGNEYVANEVGNYTVKAIWGSEDLTEEYAYGEATIAVTVKAAPAAELPVVKNGNEEISRDTWGYELSATTQFTISSTNAAAIRVWKNDELYTNAEGNDWAVENGAASVSIEAPALNELVKYVFAGVNTAGEVSQDQFVMTVKLPAATAGNDVLTATLFDITGTGSYTSGNYTSDYVTYAYNAAKHNSGALQLRASADSNGNYSGIVVSSNDAGYVLKQIIVDVNSNTANSRYLNVYGKSNNYQTPNDLNSSDANDYLISTTTLVKGTTITIDIDGDYKFIGVRSKSSAIYLNSITFVWAYPTPEQPAVATEGDNAWKEILEAGQSISWTVKEGCVIKVTKLDGFYGTTTTSAPKRAASLTGEVPSDGNWTLSNDDRTATYTAPADAEKVSYRIVAVNAAGEESKPFMFDTENGGGVSGIDAVEADDTEAIEYYNLQGVRVEAENLTPGLYITRQGNTISKVVVR